MRIVGGDLRGRRLASVGKGGKFAGIRPTSDKIRESVFNVLMHGPDQIQIEGSRVLDLFAGTGAMGLEALSRGASFAMFVDRGAAAIDLIRQNITACDASARAAILKSDATRLRKHEDQPFDLIFLDPPYGRELCPISLDSAASQGWMAPDATIVCEDSERVEAPSHFSLATCKTYGETVITILKHIA